MSSVVIQGDTSGSVTIQAPTVSGTTIINLPTVTGGSFIVGDSGNNVSLSSNLTFTGTASRIIGDMTTSILGSSAPLAFQTSTVNSLTQLYVIPNGTSKSSYLLLSSGTSADENFLQIGLNNAGSQAGITVGKGGTAAYLPLTFSTGNSEAFRVGTGVTGNDKGTVGIGYTALTGAAANNSLLVVGNVGIGTNAPTTKFHVVQAGDAVRFESASNGAVNTYWKNSTQQYSLRLDTDNNGTRDFSFYDVTNNHLFDRYYQGASGYRAFYTVGTEKMRINSAGKVGIGTTAPDLLLTVAANTSGNNLTSVSDYRTLGGVHLSDIYNTANYGPTLLFDHGTLGAGISSSRVATNTWGTDLRFFTHPDATSAQYALSERMRIDQAGNVMIGYTSTTSSSANSFLVAGNVGIGTNAPVSKLNVAGTFTITAAGMQLDNNQAVSGKNTSGTSRQMLVIDASNNLIVGGTVDGGTIFNTNLGNEAMRIDALGNVRIGATSSIWNEKLTLSLGASTPNANVGLGIYHSAGSGYTGSLIRVQTETIGTGWKMFEGRGQGGGVLYWVDGTGAGYFAGNVMVGYTSTTTQVGTSLLVAGNVGIGTNGPSYPLHISASTGQTYLTSSTGTNFVRHTINNTSGTFQFGIDNSAGSNYFGATPYGRAIFSDSAYPLGIFTNGTLRMQFDAVSNVMIGYTTTTSNNNSSLLVAGNIGVGTNAPVAKLDIAANALAAAVAVNTNSNGSLPAVSNGLVISQNYTGGTAGAAEIDFFFNSSTYLGDNGGFRFYQRTGATTVNEMMRMTQNAVITYTGGTERMRIDSSGNLQIASPANGGALANLFLGMNSIPGSMGNAYLYANTGVVVTNNGAANPFYQWYNTQSAANQKTWRMGSQSGGNLIIETVNDAYSSSNTRFAIDASGYVTNPVNGNGNGLHQAYQFYRLNTAFGGTNATGAQNIFPNNLTLVGSTVYEFEIEIGLIKTAGTTSHIVSFGFGGTATLNNISYGSVVSASAASAGTTYGTPLTGFITTAAQTSATTAQVTAAVTIATIIKGTVSVNAGGTFVPQYSLSAAPGGAYSTQIGSYFKIAAVSAAGANTAIGTWA